MVWKCQSPHLGTDGKLGSNKCGGVCEMGRVGTAKCSHRGSVIIHSAGVSSGGVGTLKDFDSSVQY